MQPEMREIDGTDTLSWRLCPGRLEAIIFQRTN
jgi:hypothetical protein